MALKRKLPWNGLALLADVPNRQHDKAVARICLVALLNGLALCTLLTGSRTLQADTISNFFTGEIALDGDISDFFDVTGTNALPGVCVKDDPQGADGLDEPPLGRSSTLDGLQHPSGFNQRRIMSAFNPFLHGGTIFIGVDLPGGTGSSANPDFADGVVGPGGVTGLTIRPFDADGNGLPETIGVKSDGTALASCADLAAGDTLDVLSCSGQGAGATDDPTDFGAVESYTVAITFPNGAFLFMDLREDALSGTGKADLLLLQTAGLSFGAKASLGDGRPLGFDVELAITNVNGQFAVADLPSSPALEHSVQVWSGSNRADSQSSYDFNGLLSQYVASGAQLSLAATDSPDPVRVNRTLTYRFTVANRGAVPASDVLLSSVLPTTVTFLSASSTAGDCSVLNGVVTCLLGEFPESATVSILVNPTTEGVITNTVSVTSSDAPPIGPVPQTTVVRRSGRAQRPLSIASQALPSGEVGVPYRFDTKVAVHVGQPPYSVSVSAGALPSGLELDDNGLILGTPTQADQAVFELTVRDATSEEATGRFVLRIMAPVRIATSALKPGRAGKPYRTALRASKGLRPYRWSAEGLPDGLVLDAATGLIVGTVTNPVAKAVAVRVTDFLGGSAEATLDLVID